MHVETMKSTMAARIFAGEQVLNGIIMCAAFVENNLVKDCICTVIILKITEVLIFLRINTIG
jgi:hypothetical protein